MAVIRQLVRRGVKDLTVVGSGIALNLLIAAGCVRRTMAYYVGGGAGGAVAPSFRRAAEAGAAVPGGGRCTARAGLRTTRRVPEGLAGAVRSEHAVSSVSAAVRNASRSPDRAGIAACYALRG